MGKRKSSRKPTVYIKPKLDTVFSCLFCNHEKCVTCQLDKKELIGSLKCKVCGQRFTTTITALSAPVDVYSDWVDVCEDINNEEGEPRQQQSATTGSLDGAESDVYDSDE